MSCSFSSCSRTVQACLGSYVIRAAVIVTYYWIPPVEPHSHFEPNLDLPRKIHRWLPTKVGKIAREVRRRPPGLLDGHQLASAQQEDKASRSRFSNKLCMIRVAV